jgi:hypothetical protein
MLEKRDRDGRAISTAMQEVFFKYSRLVTPFREKRIERDRERKKERK